MEQFDAFTRRLSGGGSSRRQALRALGAVLLGGAFTGVAARLGLADIAEAKKHKPKPKRKRAPQAERKAHGQLGAEGKGEGKDKGKKGKGKGKSKKKPPAPLPPGCQNCNGCQMCRGGACVPDPALDGVRCLGSGAACGYCQGGTCTATTRQPCDDGVCPRASECCPEKRQCGDQCVPADQCCEDEFKCLPDGPCVGQYDCCPGDGPKKCPDPFTPRGFYCVDQNVCCPERERQCDNGACLPMESCCPEQKRCGPKWCVRKTECCPNETPTCGACEEAFCDNGTWICRPKPGLSTCQECPAGSEVCPGVPPDWYDLPPGCCPDDHYFPDPRDGEYVCSSPPGQSVIWAVCDVASRGARSGTR